MDTLYSWTAKRSGASITIEHSCGRITGVILIEPVTGSLIASTAIKQFILHVPRG